jgi:hypothetical protein
MHKTREFTNKVLEAIDNGLLDRDQVILACLGWMSEKSVEGMCEANEFFAYEDEEDSQEDIDNPNWVGSRHHY